MRPEPPLQSLHELRVLRCPVAAVRPILEQWHYSHSVFGITDTVCYAVRLGPETVGGAIFGLPQGAGVYWLYSEGERHRLLELRRFVMIDALPRNNESFVLARMFRLLRRDGIARILSYADPSYGHQGVIYKATGFTLVGKTQDRKHVLWRGKQYPDRNIHQTKFPYHRELRAALVSGEAERVVVPGKFIYLKNLDGTPVVLVPPPAAPRKPKSIPFTL